MATILLCQALDVLGVGPQKVGRNKAYALPVVLLFVCFF